MMHKMWWFSKRKLQLLDVAIAITRAGARIIFLGVKTPVVRFSDYRKTEFGRQATAKR
jgi:hypothetical protein